MIDLKQWRLKTNRLVARAEQTAQQLAEEEATLEAAESRAVSLVEARTVITTLAQHIQQQLHIQIADVVSRCLEAVFDEPYQFRILFEPKRGRTEARLVFCRDGMEVDPLTASGGGVVDVAAFALRLACLVIQRPPVRRLLVMDEPFKFVSAQYIPGVRDMLESLSKDMGVQIIMVTHIEGLHAGKVVELQT